MAKTILKTTQQRKSSCSSCKGNSSDEILFDANRDNAGKGASPKAMIKMIKNLK